MRRERSVGGLVRKVVADVRKKGAFGSQSIGDADRILDGGMGRMRLVAQAIEKQDIKVLQAGERCFGDVTEIGEIGGAAEAVSEDFSFPVNHWNWLEGAAEQLENSMDRLEFEPGEASEFVVGVEDIAEHVADELGGIGASVERNFTVAVIAEWAKVVDAEDVVGVGMGIEDRIDLRDVLANGLLAKIGGGVNEHRLTAELEQDRRAGSAIVRIGRMADRAAAPNGGHAHRCAAAQHGKRCLHRGLLPATAPGLCGGRERAFVTST